MHRITRAALGRGRFPATRDEAIARSSGRKTPRPASSRPIATPAAVSTATYPLPELANLEDFLRTQGVEENEDLIRGMQEHFGLGRLIPTRQRIEAAIMSEEK